MNKAGRICVQPTREGGGSDWSNPLLFLKRNVVDSQGLRVEFIRTALQQVAACVSILPDGDRIVVDRSTISKEASQ